MKNLKLLRIISSMDPSTGGPPMGISYVNEALKGIGIDTTIVCLDDPNAEFIQKSALNLIALGKSKGPWQFNAALGQWLNINLKNYDVSIVHGLWLYTSFSSIRAFKKLIRANSEIQYKIFLMPHGMLDPYFQNWAHRGIKPLRNFLYWHFIEKYNVKNYSGLFFTSELELNLARDTFNGYKPQNEYMVGYGLKIPAIDKVKNIPKLKEDYFLFLGRIHPKKGIEILLNAYEKIIAENQIILPSLLIAGPGWNSKYGEDLKKKILSNVHLKNKIILKDALTGTEKWQYLKQAKALILYSYQENFGLVVAESLGMATPVIVSKAVNIYELIDNYMAGFSGELNLNELVNILRNFQSLSLNEYVQMKENARKLYDNQFEPNTYSQRLKDFLVN